MVEQSQPHNSILRHPQGRLLPILRKKKRHRTQERPLWKSTCNIVYITKRHDLTRRAPKALKIDRCRRGRTHLGLCDCRISQMRHRPHHHGRESGSDRTTHARGRCLHTAQKYRLVRFQKLAQPIPRPGGSQRYRRSHHARFPSHLSRAKVFVGIRQPCMVVPILLEYAHPRLTR